MKVWKKHKNILYLNILLLIYSLGGIFSKSAGKADFLSGKYICLYLGLLCILAIYAVFWQQIIKTMPLTTAYANKAIVVVWGILWGRIFFDETITFGKIVGALMVIIGVVIYSLADDEKEKTDE